jgi:hypothetical protein
MTEQILEPDVDRLVTQRPHFGLKRVWRMPTTFVA